MDFTTGRRVNPRISKKIKPYFKLLFFSSAVLFAASEGFSQWTDPVLTSRVTPVKAVHVTELRTQINTNLGVCLQPTQVWTNVTLTPRSTTIKKIDLDELRAATTNLVNAYRVQQSLPLSPPVYTDAAIVARTTPIRAVHFSELRTFVSGATCTAGCPAQALAWNVGANACSASAPATAVGSSAAISDTIVPLTGAAQFSCNIGGVWAAIPNVGATCAACLPVNALTGGDHFFAGNSYNFTTWIGVGGTELTDLCCSGIGKSTSPSCPGFNCAAVDVGVACAAGCPAQNLSWLVAGNTCTGAFPATTSPASATASNVTAGLNGSATFQCTAGAWAGVPNVGATCSTGCLLNLPLGWDGGVFPVVSCYSLPLLPLQIITVPEGATHTEQGFGPTDRCGEISIKCVGGIRVTTAKTCTLGLCF